MHPATGRALLEGSTCGECSHAHRFHHHDSFYWKCARHRLGESHSAASDIRVGWPACTLFEVNDD